MDGKNHLDQGLFPYQRGLLDQEQSATERDQEEFYFLESMSPSRFETEFLEMDYEELEESRDNFDFSFFPKDPDLQKKGEPGFDNHPLHPYHYHKKDFMFFGHPTSDKRSRHLSESASRNTTTTAATINNNANNKVLLLEQPFGNSEFSKPCPVTGGDAFERRMSGSRTRSYSISVPIVTQSSYKENTSQQSPAVSFLSQFAPSSDESYSEGEFIIKDNMTIKNYVVGRIIGRSNFSECREGFRVWWHHPPLEESTGESTNSAMVKVLPDPVALKITKVYPENSGSSLSFEKEIQIWSSLSHPNILPLTEVFSIKQYKVAVSPLAIHGDLLHYINRRGPLSINKARGIFKQIVSALRYLHKEKKMHHRDLKLDNILLHKNDHVYLADFGLSETFDLSLPSRELEDILINSNKKDEYTCVCKYMTKKASEANASVWDYSLSSTTPTLMDNFSVHSAPTSPGPQYECHRFATGTVWYCPPEEIIPDIKARVFSCFCSRYLYGDKADIWALGVVLYALLSGALPFVDEFLPRLQMSIRQAKYKDLPESIPQTVKHLVKSMLNADCCQRYSIDDVLLHSWIKEDVFTDY